MNTTVTARVPIGIKEQVDRKLKAMGSNTTELINAAYDYVLANDKLPKEKGFTVKRDKNGNIIKQVRRLTPEQKEALKKRIEETTFDIPESFWQGKSTNQIIEEARDEYLREKYADYY